MTYCDLPFESLVSQLHATDDNGNPTIARSRPHDDVLIFVRFLMNGPRLFEIIDAFPECDRSYLMTRLQGYIDCSDASYALTLTRFWIYLDDNNKAKLWSYIRLWDYHRNGPSSSMEKVRQQSYQRKVQAKLDALDSTSDEGRDDTLGPFEAKKEDYVENQGPTHHTQTTLF